MIISYAQNFEDIMLWRALGHIKNGFYIDVGANDPNIESVTRLFYDNGWSGINIEPVEQWFVKLEDDRKRDINLRVAAGIGAGELTLYDFPDTGLCTSDKATAERHERDRGYTKKVFKAEIRTLAEICEKYCHSDIHFLKIDVEGAELDVLQGMDFERFRPWIVLIEATIPNLPTGDYSSWEPLILQSGYHFVYFDGLNRFYISQERHEELCAFFEIPPNVFDEFELARVINARVEASERVALAQRETAEKTVKVALLGEKLEKISAELHAEHQSKNQILLLSESRAAEIEAIRSSLSWKFTGPLRWMARPVLGEINFSGWSGSSLYERLIRWGMRQPRLVSSVHALADLVPPLRRAITRRVAIIIDDSVVDNQFTDNIVLTPHALQIYEDLKDAIVEGQGGKN